MHRFRSRPPAPIRRLHARRTQVLAGAAATAVAVGVLVGPVADGDAFGAVGRAEAAVAEPTATPSPAGPRFPDVSGVDLATLGYRGVDLDAVTVASLDRALPELPMERASEIRARIVVGTAHLEGLREAEYLLYEASRSMNRDVRETRNDQKQAWKVQAEADAAVARAQERALEAARRAEAAVPTEPAPPDRAGGATSPGIDVPGSTGETDEADAPGKGKAGKGGKANHRTPKRGGGAAEAEQPEEDRSGTSNGPMMATARPADDDGAAAGRGPRVGRPAAEAVAMAAQVVHAEAVAEQAWAESAALGERLGAQLERRSGFRTALERTAAEAHRMVRHVDYLYNELRAAQAGMRAAGRWLAEAERGRVDVPTARVKGFRVHASVASSLRDLLRAARADGIVLTSASSYRSINRQIELRKQNCGPTEYDIYQRPSGTCSPPTARPGRSLHESGLAIDFQHAGESIVSRSSPAYRWLAANAPSYGFYNLPSEPWHWSVSGY